MAALDLTPVARFIVSAMLKILVRCLLWMLMAALPLQGSAALFATCKAAQPPAASHGCHEQAATDGAPVPDDGGALLKSHGKCSTCASCCTAATAPPGAAPMPAPFPRASRAVPAVEPSMTAIFPSGLERPPRAV
jgi:hypothetical protein